MEPLGIIEVEHQNERTLLINFNDGTFASFSTEELAAIHPNREVGDGENADPGQDIL